MPLGNCVKCGARGMRIIRGLCPRCKGDYTRRLKRGETTEAAELAAGHLLPATDGRAVLFRFTNRDTATREKWKPRS